VCARLLPRLGAAVALVLVLIPTGSADDTERATEQSFFEEVAVVSASRVSQPISDAPGTIIAITHDQLVAMGARTLNDVLRFVPGFDMRTAGCYQYGAFRGLGTVEDGKRVLWMVDGRPVNRVIRSDYNVWLALDLDEIEQIEIIRGPGSALYGPNAFSGVVNIITRPPGAASGTTLGLVAGNAGTWSPSLHAGWDAGEWRYGLSGIVHRWDAYVGHAVNDYDFVNCDEVSFRAARRGLSISAGHTHAVQGDSMDLTGPAENESHRAGWYVDAQREWDLTARSSISLRTSFSHEKERMVTSGFETPLDERFSLADLTYRADLGQGHSLVLGTECRFQTGITPVTGRRPSTNRAVFVQDAIELGSAWCATVGARYDAHSTYGNVLSPRIALVRRVSDRTRIKASYGEAFRPPDLSALYAELPLSPTYWIVSNPDLRPERLRTSELGVRWQTSASSVLEVDLYHTRARDLIHRTEEAGPGGVFISRNENLAAAAIYGAEISLDARSRSGNRSFVNYSYQHTRSDRFGGPLMYAPDHKLSFGYTFGAGRARSATLLFGYVGRRLTETEEGVWVGGYGVADAVVRWRSPSGIEYSLAVYNLLDRRYEETIYYPIQGRTWQLRAALCY
jgi:outer membrane receptor for ferrienterochelin and colicin